MSMSRSLAVQRRTAKGWFAVLAVLSLASPAARAETAAEAKQASQAFAEASKLFDQADYVGAIEAFTKAYSLRPHFSVLCNIALSHERLGDMIRAASFYNRCLAEGAEKTENAEAVRNSIKRVEGRVAWFEITAPAPGGEVYVDGKAMGSTPRRVALNPGQHVIEVRRPGAEPGREAVTIRGGEQRSLELAPREIAASRPVAPEQPPAPTRRRLHPAWFLGSAGLAVVFGVVATVLGVQTLSLKSDYEANPTRELYDRGRNRRLLTNIFWAGAAASAGTGAVLFFYTDFGRLRGSGERGDRVSFGIQGTF